jgi:hypothetical protein
MGASTHKSGRPRGRPLGAKAEAIREAVLGLTNEYSVMTVRQAYYQLEVRGVVPKDHNTGYRPTQKQILAMRRQRVLPWEFIADGTRWRRKPETWDSLEDALAATARTYRRNLWRSQNVRIEIWLEKDALADVVLRVTDPWDVSLMVSRGQSSDTYVHSAARYIDEAARQGIRTHVFLLYDADRAGRDSAAKITEKIHTYSDFGDVTRCKLLAVTDEQITEWDLPDRPDKQCDGRAVELDAIPPDMLLELVDDAISGLVDERAWEAERVFEQSEREIAQRMYGGHDS